MATITAQPGIKTAFAGGADEIVCNFSPVAEKGVQIEASGFTLDAGDIEIKGASGGDGDVIPFTEARHIAVIGASNSDRAKISQAKISGVAGGSYFVTFTAL